MAYLRRVRQHSWSIALILVVIADVILTLWMAHEYGKGMERNPLLSWLVDNQPGLFAAVKILPVVLIVYLVVKAKREAWMKFVVAAYVGLYFILGVLPCLTHH